MGEFDRLEYHFVEVVLSFEVEEILNLRHKRLLNEVTRKLLVGLELLQHQVLRVLGSIVSFEIYVYLGYH